MQHDSFDQNEERLERLQQFTQYVWEGRKRGLSRREFLRVGIAAGITMPAITAILTGCGVDQTAQAVVPPTATPAPPTATLAPPTATPAPPTATSVPPTATATPVPPKTVLGVIGDFGWDGPDELAVAEMVKGWNPDTIVTTGDNNYPLGDYATIDENIGKYYGAYMKASGSQYATAEVNRFWPVLGNHDTDIDLGAPYLQYFDLPGNERYYMVEYPAVRIFAMNSVAWVEPDGVYAESVQSFWLRDRLAESPPDVWNLVFYHHPPYTSGWKGASSWMRWPFKEWGAHATLNGHQHSYERIMLDGFPYFTNGLGGGPRYDFIEPVEGSVIRYFQRHGAMRIEATPDRCFFEFITIDGDVIDTYELTREV